MSTAPADVSVKYNEIKYNFTKSAQKFVGYGPEVDTAWREISYDGMSLCVRILCIPTNTQ